MRELKETHMKGFLSVESIQSSQVNADFGIQIAKDGRVWICINGQAFIRFKPQSRFTEQDHIIWQEGSKTFRQMPQNYCLMIQNFPSWEFDIDSAVNKDLACDLFRFMLTTYENKYERNPEALLARMKKELPQYFLE